MPRQPGSSSPVLAFVAALGLGLLLGVGGVFGWNALGTDPEEAPPPEADGMGMGGMPPATVRVGAVTQVQVQDRFDVVGRLVELRRTTVAAESAGKILTVPMEEGDRVVGGETVLARIDPIWSAVALEAAEARVAAAEAQLERSEREKAYLEELQQGGAARPKEVDDARAQAKADRAALGAALAERNEARQRAGRVDVLAPFDGHVVRKLVEVGQWVEPGGAVAEVVSAGEVDAVVGVPERLINQVRVGGRVEVTVEPLDRRFGGEVVAVVPSAATAARTFPVKIRLSDEGGLLKPGMSVLAHLPAGESSLQLTMPRDAVLFQGGRATVWAAVEPSPAAEAGAAATGEEGAGGAGPAMPVAASLPVEVLFGVGDRYAVRGALEPGMRVVIEGGEMLMPQQPLIVLGASEAAARP